MTTILTPDHLEERAGATFYTGPLEPAVNHIARQGRDLFTFDGRAGSTALIGFVGEKAGMENFAEIGRGATADEALRFALGAFYGPAGYTPPPIDLDS